MWSWASHWTSLPLFSQLFNEGIALCISHSWMGVRITWELAKMHFPGSCFRKPQVEPKYLSAFLTSTLGDNDINQSSRAILVNPYFLTSDVCQNDLKSFFFQHSSAWPPSWKYWFSVAGNVTKACLRNASGVTLLPTSDPGPQDWDVPLPDWDLLRGAGAERGRTCPWGAHSLDGEAQEEVSTTWSDPREDRSPRGSLVK